MKFKCCESVLHYLIISPASLFVCCTPNSEKLLYLDTYNGGRINIDDYIKYRNEFIENCKKGIYPQPCKKCNLFEEKEWDESLGFTSISISNRTFCSCHCIYCLLSNGGNDEIKRKLNSFEPYDVVPLLEQLYEHNLVKEGCQIVLGGGECSEYPSKELEYFNVFTEKTSSKLIFYSSGIKYSPIINNGLRQLPSQMKIAVDAGTANLYKKIKRVDAYDLLWENIKKYSETIKQNKNSELILKYVIIPGVNDSIREVNSFIEKCVEVECGSIEVVIEYYWLQRNINNRFISKQLKEVLELFSKQKKVHVYMGISYAEIWKELKREVEFDRLPVV